MRGDLHDTSESARIETGLDVERRITKDKHTISRWMMRLLTERQKIQKNNVRKLLKLAWVKKKKNSLYKFNGENVMTSKLNESIDRLALERSKCDLFN